MGFLKEFKEFAMKGNVLDMAVGVIIGGAFGKIVSSLVNDILMPAIGGLIGNVDFTTLSVKLGEDPELRYGNFIQVTVDFLIIAFSIFVMIKAINKAASLRKKKEEEAAAAEPAAPAPKPDDVALLEEIRDLLKEKK